ncbi:MAG TPA: DUF6285 domain-containing protein [Candidatus Lustribacter sp.]
MLTLARETLQNDLAPAVPANARFTAAMIGQALAIAARMTLDRGPADRTVAEARAALPNFPDERALVAAIRSGALDAASTRRTAALAYAASLVRRRLALTNPARLDAALEPPH